MHDPVRKHKLSLHFLHYHRFCLGALRIKTRGAQKITLHFSELWYAPAPGASASAGRRSLQPTREGITLLVLSLLFNII